MQPERADTPRPITEADAFRSFTASSPGLRRWYIARVFGEARPTADLYFAEATEAGWAALEHGDLERIDEDRTEWWHDEDFDRSAHLPVEELATLLASGTSALPLDALIEGAVFLELPDAKGGTRFLPFSHQARTASMRLYQRLLKQDDENEPPAKQAR